MSERDPDIDLSVEAQRARDLLRRLEAPRPDGEFRARLKETFVAGTFDEARDALPAPAAEPEEAPRRGGIGSMDDGPRRGGIGAIEDDDLDRAQHRPRTTRPDPRTIPDPRTRPTAPPRPPRTPLFRFPKPTRPRFISILAAAAAIAVVVGIIGNRGPQWRVLRVVGTGFVQADGEAIPVERVDQLAERLHPGVELLIPETASLEIAAGSDLAMAILPGTRLTIPPAPPRWFPRRSEFYARGGEVRLTTGPTFQGARLDVHTTDAMVRVTGTTLAVIMEPTGTCVCVLEGEVMVGARGESAGPQGAGGDAMMPITSGQRAYVFRDGRTPERADIRPTELVELAKFRALRNELLEQMAH